VGFRRFNLTSSFCTRTAGAALAAALAFVALLPARPSAHEIPSDVRVQMYLKPEGQRLRVLARVPLAAANRDDVQWPTRAPGILDLANIDDSLQTAAREWLAANIEVLENDRPLGEGRVVAARVSLPSDDSFLSYDTALANITGPALPDDSDVVMGQGFVDAVLEWPIESDAAKFSLRVDFMDLGVTVLTVLRYLPPGAAERVYQIHDDPGLIRLDPRWFHAAWQFTVQGFNHILDGIDHLLFLFCLVIPFRQFGSLIRIVTAFTVAHSITLIASAYGMAPEAGWFPPLVETLIAASIVYMALENIVAPGLKRRWAITFGFGLIHGFGFSFALRDELQFAGSHLITALLSFNVGVELGQLLVLAIMVPALAIAFRFVMAERIGTIILSALVAHTGWHWMTERGSQLMLYQFQAPVIDLAFFAWLVRWLMLGVFVALVVWLLSGVLGKYDDRASTERHAA
jgi:hypothetical protein